MSRVADDLAGKVVEVRLEDPDPVARGRERDLADEEAEDVRLLGNLTRAGSQADRVDRHRRQGAEPLDDRRQDGRPGRGRQLHLHVGIGERHALQKLGRSGRRQRHPPVRSPYRAATRRHRAGFEPLDAQQVETDGSPDDIDDRIDRSDLMEMDLLERDPMNGRLGLAKAAKDPLGQLVLARGQTCLVDHVLDMMQVPMHVLGRRFDHGVRRPKAPAADGLESQLTIQTQAGNGRLNRPRIDTRIDQRPQGHVARDAAEAVEIADAHA